MSSALWWEGIHGVEWRLNRLFSSAYELLLALARQMANTDLGKNTILDFQDKSNDHIYSKSKNALLPHTAPYILSHQGARSLLVKFRMNIFKPVP